MKAQFLLLAWLVASSAAHAQVYRCKMPNGTTAFSDAPCEQGAKPIEVRPATGAASSHKPPALAPAAPQTSSAPPSLQDRADAAGRRRGLENEIDFKERHIVSLRSEMNAELDALRAKKTMANNNLAGATWEQSISSEMSAVVSRYDARIRGLESEVERLRADLDRIGQ